MTLPATHAELDGWPEHKCDEAAHIGDPHSTESAVALTESIAESIAQLIRGGHLSLEDANAVFGDLLSRIPKRRKSGHA